MIGNLTGESFLIALSGMVIVFLMLAILCLFIPVISKCVRFFEKRRQKPEPVRPAPAAVPQADPAPAAAQQADVWGGEVALIGVDDDRFGEAVAAAIVLNPGCTLSDEELIAYCRANLPSYKKPRYVAFVDELPHNVTGKIQKSVLRENADKLFRPVRGL